MIPILAIFRRELRAYFTSPIAYAVLAFFMLLTGVYFSGLVDVLERLAYQVVQATQLGRQAPPVNLNETVVRGYFGFVVFFLPLLLAPALTMRLFSEEKKQGTIELLLTTPITDVQIVWGKYLAALAMYMVMVVATLAHMLFLYAWGTPDTGPILTGYLGLFLIGAAYIALGMFISSLTENQIVAAVTTMSIGLILYVIGFSGQIVGETLGSVLEYVSVLNHFDDFQKGVIDTRDVVYFLSFAGLAVFLTLRSVESMRWRG